MKVFGKITVLPKFINNKWSYVNFVYSDLEEFNEASGNVVSKMNEVDSDGKFTIQDSEDNYYELEVIHYKFDLSSLTINLLPYSMEKIEIETA